MQFQDTLRSDTQAFLKFRDSIFEICLHLIHSNSTLYFLPSVMLSSSAGTSKEIPLHEIGLSLPAILITLSFTLFRFSCSVNKLFSFLSKFNMSSNISIDSTDSDVFFVEQISTEPNPQRNNSPNFLFSMELSGARTTRMPSISSIASAQPQILTIHEDSNESTMPYGFRRQLPIVPPSLNGLNLPPNPFNLLATMAVINHTEDRNNDNYSPQSPEPYELSSILTPPMNFSTFDSWETSHTTTDDNTIYTTDEPRQVSWDISSDNTSNSDDEPRRIYFVPSTPTPPPPPRKVKRKLNLGMSFPKDRGVSQHVCEACGPVVPSTKDNPGPSGKN